MAPLVAPDPVTVYAPASSPDEHGWSLPATAPVWSGMGNLQLQPGLSDPRAKDGGHGPFNPSRDRVGTIYLPVEFSLVEGSVVECRGRHYYLSDTRFVGDPSGNGDGTAPLDVWTATVTSFDTWDPSNIPAVEEGSE